VGSDRCAECHAEEHDRWRGSHHDLAMQVATSETVLGDFEDVTFEHDGRRTRFHRRGGDYLVTAEGPDGEDHDYRVAYTFGADPLQQYLLEFPGGRLQCLDVGWDVAGERWFDLFPHTDVAPDDAYHWSGRFQSWNLQCADCHSTLFEKNYDAATDTYDSRWQEIDVACEACHGPGSEHLRLAEEWTEDYRPEGSPTGLTVELDKGDPDGILDACAACHSRRTAMGPRHEAAARFEDDYRLATLSPDLYHADGQIREEVYVHGSFLQSKMHQRGVSCIDCHDPHGLDLWLPGDSTCTQCHSEDPPLDRFPTLQAKRYADETHHHHPAESEGARCVACHMPETTFMVIDPRRDHSLRVPRPDLSLTLGTPNACTGCHGKEGPAWAAEKVREWTGAEPAAHYGAALGAGASADPEVLRALLELPFDEEQPAIVRASAVERLPQGGQIASQTALALLQREGTPTLVRLAALDALVGAPAQLLVVLVAPLLEDPARLVRLEAARVLAGEAEAQLDEEQRRLFAAAFAEYVEAQRANSDAPFAHLNLAIVHERRGERARARAAYRKALELDPGFLPAVFNLATLLSTEGKDGEAEALLREAAERFPGEGELHYSLGLLMAGMERVEEAAEALQGAARLLPGRARIQYNLGLALAQLDRPAEAEGALLRAQRLEREEPDFLYALATFYLGIEELPRALEYAQQLCELIPQAPGPQQLRARIQAQLEGASLPGAGD